jgi:hypothetical protein
MNPQGIFLSEVHPLPTFNDPTTPDDRREIDELIPPEFEDDHLTWLDHAGLHRELDATTNIIEVLLRERGATHPRARIRAAVAERILRDTLSQLECADILLIGGVDRFFSVLTEPRAPRADGRIPVPTTQLDPATTAF